MLKLETGLSDFQKMTMATFKSELSHQKPKIISYQNYKHFDHVQKEIKNTLITQKIWPKDFIAFKKIVLEALNLHPPLKTKYLQANHSSFISKDFSKAIIHRSKLRTNSLNFRHMSLD